MRTKIDYGIYLGTSFCQLARMENGVPVIKKTDTLKDSLPLCVAFNKSQDVLVGDSALILFKNDKLRRRTNTNAFIEFTRTLGTTRTYESVNTGKSYSSEELLAECFKRLKFFVVDEDIKSVVITVPSKFLSPQLEAVRKAGLLAGFEQIELVQEPIATAIGYGLGGITNGYLLIFDFQNEFKVALVKSEDGIISVKDTDGDAWLGSKNLDEATVDQLIIPNLQEKYAIESILEDTSKRQILRDALKYRAEEVKIQLSFKDTHHVLSDLGELQFEDDNGEEPEIDLEVNQADMDRVLSPIFQKAIDITKELLKRNNLKGSDLGALILVGDPTYSPILRRMLKEQITDKVDTSVDPMTVVAKGAALFASTISVSEEVKETTRDKTKLQLDIKYEATTVELDEMVNLKVLKEKTTGTFPAKVYADVVRFDGAWSSGKKAISERAIIIDVLLVEGISNSFEIKTFDEFGKFIECEPNSFSINQGIGNLERNQVLPYHIGVAKYFVSEGKELFMPIKGLEKNKTLPATGVINGFKTTFDLRPGMISDVVRFPIYQGDYNAEGTDPLLNNYIMDIVISGESLPALLPAGSDINFTVKVDQSHRMTFTAYIPYLDFTEELEIEIKPVELVRLKYIDDLKGELVLFYSDNPAMGKERFRFLLGELIRIEENRIGQDDKIKVVDLVKKELIKWK